MPEKQPVLLTVLIETQKLRWFVAGIELDGKPLPLMRSEIGNLRPYLGEPLDHQIDFLRHRLSGVLQRGCDRLWGRNSKPCQIVFVADGELDPAVPELTQGVASHFVEWMNKPPVVFLVGDDSFAAQDSNSLTTVAGGADPSFHAALDAAWPTMISLLADESQWEQSPTKKPGASGIADVH